MKLSRIMIQAFEWCRQRLWFCIGLDSEVHLFPRARVRLLEGEAVVFTWANMDSCP